VSEIKRKRGESFDAFMRRVKRRWLQSGKLLQARKVQFFVPKKSKNVQKNSAVRKVKLISKTNYLRKTGKLPEEEDSFDRRFKKRR
jgi:ribosomal protein S21